MPFTAIQASLDGKHLLTISIHGMFNPQHYSFDALEQLPPLSACVFHFFFCCRAGHCRGRLSIGSRLFIEVLFLISQSLLLLAYHLFCTPSLVYGDTLEFVASVLQVWDLDLLPCKRCYIIQTPQSTKPNNVWSSLSGHLPRDPEWCTRRSPCFQSRAQLRINERCLFRCGHKGCFRKAAMSAVFRGIVTLMQKKTI